MKIGFYSKSDSTQEAFLVVEVGKQKSTHENHAKWFAYLAQRKRLPLVEVYKLFDIKEIK